MVNPVTTASDTTYFYSTITLGHFVILLAFFFIASTLIWGSDDPRPHPLTVAARWAWRLTRRALARATVAHHRRARLRRHPLPAARVPGVSWPLGGEPR